MIIASGKKLGRYEIRSKIGEGGMGEVYLAEDTLLHRKVAIKFLTAEVAQNRQRLGRFEQEAFTASALNHPNILTVFELGDADSVRFIATEYVDGETLRQRLHSRLALREALDIAIQVASALAAAHKAGVIHRDIKPENIMVRQDDSIVKVLDFGLAKASERLSGQLAGEQLEADTRAMVNTSPGVVMGTAGYMSPEQARGLPVDERTDIWSLGVVLYEMVAGRLPFEGQTPSDVIAMILHKEPPALTRLSDEATERLDEIVAKALAKDREDRYQVAKDLLIDLRRLKQHLDFESEVERTSPPELRSTTDAMRASDSMPLSAQTSSAHDQTAASSAEYIVTEIKRHKKGLAITGGAVLVLSLALAGYLFYTHRSPALTDKDTILLADFINTTGDAVFDDTLRQALSVQLGQSPFLNIFPDQGVRDTLRYMGRSPDERVTRDIAREICERQGIKAMLIGSISNLGSHYVLTVEALNPRTGEAIAREQAEAENKEQVLKSLGQAASKLRQKLGESLGSIQKFDAPVEQATTSSLEALKAYSLGLKNHLSGRYLEAIPLYRRATELDPNFAIAHARLAAVYSNSRQYDPASQAGQKAFDLRDRASEREKFYISDNYYALVTLEVEKDIETLELWKQTYPRDYVPYNNLALRCGLAGQFEKAVANGSESIRLNPNAAPGYTNTAFGFIGLNRFDEATEVVQQALAKKLDTSTLRTFLYNIAFIKGDSAAMKQQTDSAAGKPDEYFAWDWQTKSAEFNGQLRKAGELSARSIELAQAREVKEIAARFQAEHAATLALFEDCGHAKENVAKALAVSRARFVMLSGGRALSICGETGSLQSLIDELSKRWPNDTLLNNVWLPLIKAGAEIRRGNFPQAVQLLEATRRYEAVGNFEPQYLRGQVYLAQSKGKEAAAEFQTILDHRGWAVSSPLYPLAHLGLARAAVLQGDTAQARKSYQDFFALWKDADADIPILIKAKKEYDQLK